MSDRASLSRRAQPETMAGWVRETRLDDVAMLLDAVAPCGDEIAASGLARAAALLRRIGASWEEDESARELAVRRWDDVPMLADVCVSVAMVAARRRGRVMGRRECVSDRLRCAARLLADAATGRDELVFGALDLSWVAGAMTPTDPPGDDVLVEDVIRVLLDGIALAATVADLDHPRAYDAWTRRHMN